MSIMIYATMPDSTSWLLRLKMCIISSWLRKKKVERKQVLLWLHLFLFPVWDSWGHSHFSGVHCFNSLIVEGEGHVRTSLKWFPSCPGGYIFLVICLRGIMRTEMKKLNWRSEMGLETLLWESCITSTPEWRLVSHRGKKRMDARGTVDLSTRQAW